jgi:hypothetical protein
MKIFFAGGVLVLDESRELMMKHRLLSYHTIIQQKIGTKLWKWIVGQLRSER